MHAEIFFSFLFFDRKGGKNSHPAFIRIHKNLVHAYGDGHDIKTRALKVRYYNKLKMALDTTVAALHW